MNQARFNNIYSHKPYLDVFPNLKDAHNFWFNGRSLHDFDAIVTKPPPIDFAYEHHESFTIPGRDGTLHEARPSYRSRPKPAECVLFTQKYLSELAGWLRGSGNVIFSTERNFSYRAIVRSPIPLEWVFNNGFRSFLVQFEVQPFKYSNNPENDFLSTTEHINFFGKGSRTAEPVITIFGTGNITLTINGSPIQLIGVSGHITLNSEIMDAYSGNTNLNNRMTGAFPILRSNGEMNTISWTGNVQRVEIIPNWRWY